MDINEKNRIIYNEAKLYLEQNASIILKNLKCNL